jgi:predicted aspartyl protease
MGTFYRPLTLIGPTGESTSLNGMVDTGAHFTVVPRSTLQRLGVQSLRRIPVQFANGNLGEWDLGQVIAQLEEQESPILVLFGEDEGMVLIGAHALGALLLDADVVEKKLVPKRALLMTVEAFTPLIPEVGHITDRTCQ